MRAKGKAKRIQMSAVVTRADGTVHDYGVVADSALRWRFGPGRLLTWLRIRTLNRSVNLK
jgi:hypothetical protein